jgi:hypothetical protein
MFTSKASTSRKEMAVSAVPGEAWARAARFLSMWVRSSRSKIVPSKTTERSAGTAAEATKEA